MLHKNRISRDQPVYNEYLHHNHFFVPVYVRSRSTLSLLTTVVVGKVIFHRCLSVILSIGRGLGTYLWSQVPSGRVGFFWSQGPSGGGVGLGIRGGRYPKGIGIQGLVSRRG